MAETVHLSLKINGVEVKGESPQTSLGRANTIECLYYEQEVRAAQATGGGMPAGRRQYQPLLIRKRIDKSSPLLLKALTQNQAVEGTFRFYRPNPTGDGTTEQFYTVVIKQARLAAVRQYVPDILTPATAAQPPLEEVSFVFQSISWTYTNGGVTHEDNLGTRSGPGE